MQKFTNYLCEDETLIESVITATRSVQRRGATV